MIPKHWIPKYVQRFDYLDPHINKAKEDFDSNSAVKCFQGTVKRFVSNQNILFRINLETRRMKMKSLIENEEKEVEDEYFRKIVPIEVKRAQLRESANRIRLQKEIERQAIAAEKQFERERLADDGMRMAQRNIHLHEITKDWKKIKEINERIRREDKCEDKFWAMMIQEEHERLLEREAAQKAKDKIINDDIIVQMREREEARKQELIKNEERRKEINEQMIQVLEEIKEDERNEELNRKKKKAEFRNCLDKHLKLRNYIKKKEKEEVESLDKIMADENIQKINESTYTAVLKKNETFKHMRDYRRLNRCIEEARVAEDKRNSEMSLRTQLEQERMMRKIEEQKQSKYKALIKDIKLAQKNQLVEANKKKAELLMSREEEKKEFHELFIKEEGKEKLKKEKKKEENQRHNNDLIEQIKFNQLNKIKELQYKKEEENSMKVAEEQYQMKIREIREREFLLHKHPWRVETS